MANAWTVLAALISALSGLGGVLLGSILSSRWETNREKERVKKASSYLAILVVSHLDRLVSDCASVANDNGTRYGSAAGKDGNYQTTISTPVFEPLALCVDWQTLPTSLMYSILNMPHQIDLLNRRIASVAECDDPPDFAEMFWLRQHGYAVLGLDALECARQLRRVAHLPPEDESRKGWDAEEFLRSQIEHLEGLRAKSISVPFLVPQVDPKIG